VVGFKGGLLTLSSGFLVGLFAKYSTNDDKNKEEYNNDDDYNGRTYHGGNWGERTKNLWAAYLYKRAGLEISQICLAHTC
jgi:hypothetical protein